MYLHIYIKKNVALDLFFTKIFLKLFLFICAKYLMAVTINLLLSYYKPRKSMSI